MEIPAELFEIKAGKIENCLVYLSELREGIKEKLEPSWDPDLSLLKGTHSKTDWLLEFNPSLRVF